MPNWACSGCRSPRSFGGFGGGAVEVMLVMEAFGRVLALEPYLPTVVLGGTALRLAGSRDQQEAVLPLVAEGSHEAGASRMASGRRATT